MERVDFFFTVFDSVHGFENIDLLSEKCNELFSDEEKRRAMGENLRNYMENNHDVDTVVKNLTQYLMSV